MEFWKYTSIESSFRKRFINSIYDQGLSGNEFIVQEKLHGANFSFYTDGSNIQCSKRTQFIEDHELFFNYKAVLKKYENSVIDAFKIIKERYSEVKFISITGELFGGKYPHPDVLPDGNSEIVQKEVWYAPYNDFYAFEIVINNEIIMDIDVINNIFEEVGFFYAKTLFSGKLNDALKYPNKFNSHIPDWLGLPKLEENICEGTIIKPNKALFLKDGKRVIIKNKNERWVEKGNEDVKPDPTLKLSDKGKEVFSELHKYLTLNRLNNLISKIGDYNKNGITKLSGLLMRDMMEEFNKDYPNLLTEINKPERKIVTGALSRKAVELIRNEIIMKS